MARTFKIELDQKSRAFLERAKKSFSKDVLYGAIKRFFDKQSLILAGRIIRDMLSGQRLRRRTGSLARSVTGTGVLLKGVPAIRVGVFRGPSLRYAGVHEFGTRGYNPASPYPPIVPRRAKALAFPPDGSPALTPAGVDRFGGPRGYPGRLRFIPFRRSGIAIGALYDEKQLASLKKQSKDGRVSFDQLKAVYVLIRRLDLRPQFYLKDGFFAYLPELADALGVMLRDFISGKGQAPITPRAPQT